ncbi:MAG TPA: DUF3857 domain-containing protein [Flavobacterium sp.]|jgi:transglutaminase-like putative cysteine protease
MKTILPIILLLFSLFSYSQNEYTVENIPIELKENANAVIRSSVKNVVISSMSSMKITTLNAVTILNERGLRHMDASEYYSKSRRINTIEAVILNKNGNEIRKIKRKDFKESSVSEGSVITDSKLLYLDYVPTEYPFTIVYKSEMETSNTAFIPSWRPIDENYVSVDKSVYTIKYKPDLGFKFKECNFNKTYDIKKEVSTNEVTFTASNLYAFKAEEYTPSYSKIVPYVLFGVDKFYLEGVEGSATNWKDFGSWIYDNLLQGTEIIPEATKNTVKQLVGSEKDPIKMAKIVYQYVQDKTRYVSIQLGIGGWKPMLAKDVDRLGYGDCKALTNYTRALLSTVGVESYYTVIYGDTEIRSLQQDFVSMQGNHVILAIPDKDKIIWLECTSQITPFGFQGDFTDNRLALMVKKGGGELIKTNEYVTSGNSQVSKGQYMINELGELSGNVSIISRGTQYDSKFINETKSKDDLDQFYKNYFSHINNLKLKKLKLTNNKEAVEFTETIEIGGAEYASKNGDKLIFAVNAFNPFSSVPQRYRNRNNAFEISRGFYDYDEITIATPEGYVFEAKPENFELKTQFGFYKTEYTVVNEHQLQYKRTFQTNPGYFEKTEYENFRSFREKIAKQDNAKIILGKK